MEVSINRDSHRASHDASVDNNSASAIKESTPDAEGEEPEEVGDQAQSSQSESETSASCSDVASDDDAHQQCSDEESECEEQGAAQSSVASVTADFAMQNVILQMGLRLVAPNGMRIKQLTRWVLRCSACFKITKVSIYVSAHQPYLALANTDRQSSQSQLCSGL